MIQRWRALTFVHWRYSPAEINHLLPRGIECDVFDGSGWVGLVPFRLDTLRPAMFPQLQHGGFLETNVRTYVRGPDGQRGVWFFTLDAADLMAVLGARVLYHLPYRWAAMTIKHGGLQVSYRSSRHKPFRPGCVAMTVERGSGTVKSALADFLTARFRLYAARNGRVGTAAIEHEAWPLETGRLANLDETLVRSCGLRAPAGEPVVYYSDDLKVTVGSFRWL